MVKIMGVYYPRNLLNWEKLEESNHAKRPFY